MTPSKRSRSSREEARPQYDDPATRLWWSLCPLKRARLIRGLTRAELAEKSFLNLQTVVNVELGRSAPTLTTLRRMAEALTITTGRLASMLSHWKERQPVTDTQKVAFMEEYGAKLEGDVKDGHHK